MVLPPPVHEPTSTMSFCLLLSVFSGPDSEDPLIGISPKLSITCEINITETHSSRRNRLGEVKPLAQSGTERLDGIFS